MKGYRWFVNEYLGSYEPHEETFNSIFLCNSHVI